MATGNFSLSIYFIRDCLGRIQLACSLPRALRDTVPCFAIQKLRNRSLKHRGQDHNRVIIITIITIITIIIITIIIITIIIITIIIIITTSRSDLICNHELVPTVNHSIVATRRRTTNRATSRIAIRYPMGDEWIEPFHALNWGVKLASVRDSGNEMSLFPQVATGFSLEMRIRQP